MKLPSIKLLIDEAGKSAKRFPLTLISATVGVSVAVYLIEHEGNVENIFPYINLMLVSALGLVGFFGIAVYNEQAGRNQTWKIGLNLLGAAILAMIYFSLPDEEHTNMGQPYIRYAIYNIVAHLMVSFAPFIAKGMINGFWNYNKMLFLRICLSVLYSGVVYVGIVLAMFALNVLFDADIEDETFGQLWVIVVGVFNTWFFVSGVNSNVNEHEENTTYPSGLKTFSQYVLLPLLILYLVILYAYVIKIIGLWDWPKGIVSYLIVVVAVLGIFTLLLLHPYRQSDKKDWISIFSKVYYYALLPLTVTLFLAIGIRIGDYGITINRYLIVELGVWLVFVSGYFIIGRQNIKVIPTSLAVMILFTSFGFWGMFSVSEKSQAGRLEQILCDKGILKEGKIQNEPVLNVKNDTVYFLDNRDQNLALLSDSLKNEVYSILNYLDDYHGYDAINDWFTLDPDSVQTAMKGGDKYYYYNGAKVRMELMGLEYRYSYVDGINNQRTNYYAEDASSEIKKVTGFDYIIDINHFNYNGNPDPKEDTYTMDSLTFKISQPENLQLYVVVIGSDSMQLNLSPLVTQLKKSYGSNDSFTIDPRDMIINGSGTRFDANLRISRLTLVSDDQPFVESLEGVLLIKLK
jgi:hypothetical protein